MAGLFAGLARRVIDAVVRGGDEPARGCGPLWGERVLAIKWVQRFERRGSRAASKMGGYLRPRLEPHREFLEELRVEKTDITLKALCDRLLAERGVRADTAMMSRFFRRIGVTLKKDADRARAGSCGHKAPSPALAKPSEARRPFASRLHGRDLDQDQHDPALRQVAAQKKARRQGPAQPLENRDIPGRAAQRSYRRALRVRRPHQRRAVSAYVEQFLVPTLKPNDIVVLDNQSRLPQRKGGANRDQGRRRASPVPSKVISPYLTGHTGCVICAGYVVRYLSSEPSQDLRVISDNLGRDSRTSEWRCRPEEPSIRPRLGLAELDRPARVAILVPELGRLGFPCLRNAPLLDRLLLLLGVALASARRSARRRRFARPWRRSRPRAAPRRTGRTAA